MTRKSTKTGLLLLAFISAILNYAGFTQIIDSQNTWLKAVCFMTAIGVWISLYLFWNHVFSIIPQLKHSQKRLNGWSTVLAGGVVIVAMSTYWNLVALTGQEALRLAMTGTVTKAEQLYGRAVNTVFPMDTVLPQLNGLSSTAYSLAQSEEKNGAVTGSPGKGGVSEVLNQIGGKVASISTAAEDAAKGSAGLQKEAEACLSRMRKAVSRSGVSTPGDDVAGGADCLNAAMASLGQQNAGAAVEQAMRGLTTSLVLPVSIRTDKQRAALENVLQGLQGQADAIADGLGATAKTELELLRIERPNMATAVVVHWRAIIPSIATALAIDLLPLLLLVLQVIARRDGEKTHKRRRPRGLRKPQEPRDLGSAIIPGTSAAKYNEAPTVALHLIGVVPTQSPPPPMTPPLPASPPVRQLTYSPTIDELDDDNWWHVDSDGETK